jgi:hypothetical protein
VVNRSRGQGRRHRGKPIQHRSLIQETHTACQRHSLFLEGATILAIHNQPTNFPTMAMKKTKTKTKEMQLAMVPSEVDEAKTKVGS